MRTRLTAVPVAAAAGSASAPRELGRVDLPPAGAKIIALFRGKPTLSNEPVVAGRRERARCRRTALKLRRWRMTRDELAGLDRVFAGLADAPAGLHDLAPTAHDREVARAASPEPLLELYAHCDGGRLFHESIELAASHAVVVDAAGRSQFATLEGEPVAVDARGRIWRNDPSLDDVVCEGTRLDRWIAGVVDAVAMLYDNDGEFDDDLFDDDGELLPAVAERQLRAQLKRDPKAPGPRWRLAHALLAGDQLEPGRQELEEVVHAEPQFCWAWLDLARLSERSGEIAGAVDEARAAAEAATAARHVQAGYFWAQVARLAGLAGDAASRDDAARRARRRARDARGSARGRARLDRGRRPRQRARAGGAAARGVAARPRGCWRSRASSSARRTEKRASGFGLPAP